MKFGRCTEGIDGVSIPLRGLCQVRERSGNILACVPLECDGPCQVCNPDSGQCEDCSDETCTYCDPYTQQCEPTCGFCERCDNGNCISCEFGYCQQCNEDTGQCEPSCNPCSVCDEYSISCLSGDICSDCEECEYLPNGPALCLPRARELLCLACDAGEVINTCDGECEFCSDGVCTSCEDSGCYHCSQGQCIASCSVCEMCINDQCVPYECGPGLECSGNNGCRTACDTTADCGDCEFCDDIRCRPCNLCHGGICDDIFN